MKEKEKGDEEEEIKEQKKMEITRTFLLTLPAFLHYSAKLRPAAY
jgi:hypothetical protein